MTAIRHFSAASLAACAAAGSTTAAQSRAKRKALRALHRSRRGKRINDTGRERDNTLAILATLVREPVPGIRSIRSAAAAISVSDRSVRRWLAGQHWPSITHLRALRAWARKVARA